MRRVLRWSLRGAAAVFVLVVVVVGWTAFRVWSVAHEDSRAHVDAIVVGGAAP